jgi:hypothetical protein
MQVTRYMGRDVPEDAQDPESEAFMQWLEDVVREINGESNANTPSGRIDFAELYADHVLRVRPINDR